MKLFKKENNNIYAEMERLANQISKSTKKLSEATTSTSVRKHLIEIELGLKQLKSLTNEAVKAASKFNLQPISPKKPEQKGMLKALKQNKVGTFEQKDVYRFLLLNGHKYEATRYGYMNNENKPVFVNSYVAENGENVVVNKPKLEAKNELEL
jgi:hypothetical protein